MNFIGKKGIDKERLIKLDKKMRRLLREERYYHTIGVAYTAASLAMVYGVDINHAIAAGLLHDNAKGLEDPELISICYKNKIEISDSEKLNPDLLHAKVGAYFATKKYHIKDENIISAIRWHTTGKPDMNILEKIIFLADYIEPSRDKADNLDELRKLAFSNIDSAIAVALNQTLSYVKEKGRSVDTTSQAAFDFYADALPKKYKKN